MPGGHGRRGEVLTVLAWIELWLATRAKLRDSTRRNYRTHLRCHLRPHLPDVPLAELHVGHLEQAFTRLLRTGVTPATARRVYATLRSALNAAVREHLILDNPARYVQLPQSGGLVHEYERAA